MTEAILAYNLPISQAFKIGHNINIG